MIEQNKLNELIKKGKYCSFCKVCNIACPTWQVSGREEEGPAGRLFLLQKWSEGTVNSGEIAQNILNCLQCGLCDKVCPAQLPLTKLFAQASKVLVRFAKKKNLKERFFNYVIQNNLKKHSVFYDFCQPVIALAQKVNKAAPHRFKKVSSWANEFPALELKPLRLGQPIKNDERESDSKPRILLFAGCIARRTLPGIARNTAQILQDAGCEVIFPAALTCCGVGQAKSGIYANANLKILQKLKFDYLVAICPSCLNAIKNIWPELAINAESKDYAKSLTSKAMDLSSFIVEYFNLEYINFTPEHEQTAPLFWHNPCRENRETLQNIKKLMDMWRVNLIDLSGRFPQDLTKSSSGQICCGKLPLAVKQAMQVKESTAFKIYTKTRSGDCSQNSRNLNSLIAKRARNKIIGNIAEHHGNGQGASQKTEQFRRELTGIITSCPRCVYSLRTAFDWQEDEICVKHISQLYLEKLKASIPSVKRDKQS